MSSGDEDPEYTRPHSGASAFVDQDNASPPSTSAGKTKTLRRACDCCRKRKVKCDGNDPCGPCKKAAIRCAYLQPPKKKGPKGLRSARVLHALRRIDSSANEGSISPVSPDQPDAFGNWGWGQQNAVLNNVSQPGTSAPVALDGLSASVGPEQAYLPATATSLHADSQMYPQMSNSVPNYDPQAFPKTWSNYAESMSGGSESRAVQSPVGSEPLAHRIRGEHFFQYIHLFYAHMFPIMPIIDRNIYLDHAFYTDSTLWSSEIYCFMCAICAATAVQLDTSIVQPLPLHPTTPNDEFFLEECLRERRNIDYIETPSTLSVMSSFFIFAFYGNHEKNAKAWHYLQESITFSENLNMDVEDSYQKLDPVEAQWRRRLYWLLFITERAYAVQRRKQTRLHAGVQLPAVFESEDPQLLNGFVNLANLFSAVNEDFVAAWRGSRRPSFCNEAWLADIQKQLDSAALALDNVTETQSLDIRVTREWLHVLAWQMGVSNGLIWGKGDAGMRLDYPIELARKVVQITSCADTLALDSHGIGMEQKLSDIAGCLADVLKCTAGDTSATFLEGKQYLNLLLQQLSSMRGKESRYLKPLMSKMEGVLGYELSNQTLPLPTETAASYPSMTTGFMDSRRLSVAESVGMLRKLSMTGNLGMPGLNVPLENWAQRRPSGRVYDEVETDWLMNGVAQAV